MEMSLLFKFLLIYIEIIGVCAQTPSPTSICKYNNLSYLTTNHFRNY